MPIRAQLSMLIKLANIDNDFAEDEKNMIYMVGKANGVTEEDIERVRRISTELSPNKRMGKLP